MFLNGIYSFFILPPQYQDFYIIGYILRTDKKVSELTNTFIELLKSEVSDNYFNR